MHYAIIGQVLDRINHAIHVVLDFVNIHVVKISEERLRLLIAEHQGHLALQPISLNQLSNIVLAIEVFEYQHFNQNEGGIDSGKDPFDGILLNIAVIVQV